MIDRRPFVQKILKNRKDNLRVVSGIGTSTWDIMSAGDNKGTEVRFWASEETFSNIQYDFKILEQRLRELAFLNSGVTIELVDLREMKEKRVVLSYEGGVKEFVKWYKEYYTNLSR